MPEHLITWRPGRTGKGWLFPDGSVRAWSVNYREEPHHKDVEHPEGSIRLRIGPDGSHELFDAGASPWADDCVAEAIREHMRAERSEMPLLDLSARERRARGPRVIGQKVREE